MGRKLIIDSGNTLQKLAIFEQKNILEKFTFKELDRDRLGAFLEENGPFASIILSSVTDLPNEIGELLAADGRLIVLDQDTPIPFQNLYKTPATLGRDRIAAAAGAFDLFPGRNVLSIDAGTCVTYDLLTENGEYLGGAISPGIRMRFRAMHEFTGRLPLVDYTGLSGFIGQTTEESMVSGVINGICKEIEGVARQYMEQYRDVVVVISGGDHELLHNKLKINIFAVPDLVLLGLNEILDYNERQS